MAKVFISYAREDRSFRDDLVIALESRGVEAWVDEEDIAAAVPWRGEINHGIENTDALFAVVSPDSASSDICQHEVRYAEQLGKRILPLVRRDADGLIPELADRNWIFWRSDDERERALDQIDEALVVDPEWTKLHTRLLTDTLEWERHDRDRSHLLRGTALSAAETALTVERPPDLPQPTEAMREYVRVSRTEATRRQRRTVLIAIVVAAVSIALAVAAFVQFNRANSERDRANSERDRAEAETERANTERDRAEAETIRANNERDRAEEQLRIATSRALAAQAMQLGEFGNEETGLLLAAEAASRATTDEARDAVLTLLPREALAQIRSDERSGTLTDQVVSPDGRYEVTDGGRTLVDVSTGDTQVLLDDDRPNAIFLRDVVFSPDSSRVVVSNLPDNVWQVYDLSDGLPGPMVYEVSPPRGEDAFGAAFDRANELIGVSNFESGSIGEQGDGLSISIWDEAGTEVLRAQVESALDPDFLLWEALVRVSPDDDLGALVTIHGEAQLFSARTAQFLGGMLPVECTPECDQANRDENASTTNAELSASQLATTDLLAVARDFDLSLDRWVELVCDATDTSLTAQQWERFVGADVEYDPVC